VGLGFNLSAGGREAEREEGQEQIVAFFEAFQRQLAGAWGSHLVDWMQKSGGFIQYGERAPAMELLPKQAIEWLINCRNPVGQGWIFVGRWLSLENPDDAATLAVMTKLVATVEDTFAALFPLWSSIYSV
jgi:hypothetical protein